MLRHTLVVLLLGTLLIWPVGVQAKPALQAPGPYVRVCYEAIAQQPQNTCPTINTTNSELVTLDAYTSQVLANEWDGSSSSDAFKAGAVAIRTFVNRFLGCGAYIRTVNEPSINGTALLVSNISQTYRFANNPQGAQNQVLTAHNQARNATSNIYAYRSDGVYACAKYFLDNGNPTQSCASAACTTDQVDLNTVLETIDPVDSNNLVQARTAPGMSQNATVAWTKGTVPWDYRQLLTHYYTNAKIGTQDTNYRWVWLNTGDNIIFTGTSSQEQYYEPISGAPTDMLANTSYTFYMFIQNTGTATWTAGSFKLVTQWCDANGANCLPGIQTTLSSSVSPAGTILVAPSITAPSTPGARKLKFDMMNSSGTLFSTYQSQNWPTQLASVNIRSATGNSFAPWVGTGSSVISASH